MRALLVLFLVDSAHGGFGLDDRTAAAIYGLYTAAVYLACLPGGWLGDRLLGAQRAVLWSAASSSRWAICCSVARPRMRCSSSACW